MEFGACLHRLLDTTSIGGVIILCFAIDLALGHCQDLFPPFTRSFTCSLHLHHLGPVTKALRLDLLHTTPPSPTNSLVNRAPPWYSESRSLYVHLRGLRMSAHAFKFVYSRKTICATECKQNSALIEYAYCLLPQHRAKPDRVAATTPTRRTT